MRTQGGANHYASNAIKALSVLLAVTIILPVTACSSQNAPADPFSSVILSENGRSWFNPEDKYSELKETFGTDRCNGAMAVATDDDFVYLYCEDAAEKDGTTLVSQDTVFDMASVSKTFTAVCVLQLAEKGKLSIDDTLDKYFPAYETGKNITIYNLLHMSSGIPDYCKDPDPFWNISGEDAANQKLSDIYLDKISDEEFLQAISSYFAVRISHRTCRTVSCNGHGFDVDRALLVLFG